MNEQAVTFAEIPLSGLQLNSYNARRFEENMTPQRKARFEELVDSIHKKGILEPLLVRPVDGEKHEIIAGERRYRAALQVDAEDEITDLVYMVPCMIRNVDDDEAFDIMVIENLQREDLTPFETAQSFRAYLDRHGNSHDSVVNLSARTGIPVHTIRRLVRLLILPAAVVTAWKEGSISQSHAELFTRVGDDAQIQELLGTCLRSKLTVRELAERIGAVVPDLDRGFFDKSECQECHYNTSVQGGLFADIAPAGKCGNPSCFEEKQHSFMVDHWTESKIARTYGTRGFRFNHRLPEEHRELTPGTETAPRCTECDAFVSVIRLNGTTISCYERTCVGPRVCFDELYLSPAFTKQPDPVPEGDAETEEEETETTETETKPEKTETKPPKKETKTVVEDTKPVNNTDRAQKFREAYFKTAIPAAVEGFSFNNPFYGRLQLLCLAISSNPVRKYLSTARGFEDTTMINLARQIFEIPQGDLDEEILKSSIAQVMSDLTVGAPTRKVIAELLGIDLAKEWRITRDYLEALSVPEIVKIGEEETVDIWRDQAVIDWRQNYHKGKALRSLKKAEIIAMILDSGVDLTGRVPAEIIGERK